MTSHNMCFRHMTQDFKIYLQLTSPAIADIAEEIVEGHIKTWTSREQKELLRWNKHYFSQFLRAFCLFKYG